MHTAADLALAQRHVDEGEQRIADQELLVSRLAGGGHDTARAEDLLGTLRQIHTLMRDHRDLITADIARFGAAHSN